MGIGTDTLASYGGALFDYSPPMDGTRDRPDFGANSAYSAVAGMTHTAIRAISRITLNGSATPLLVSHDARWNNALNAAGGQPTPARTSPGLYTLTYPVNVQDEIAFGLPGYVGPTALNLRAAWANDRGGTTWYAVKALITSPNVVTIRFWTFSGGAPLNTDPGSAVDVDVFVV